MEESIFDITLKIQIQKKVMTKPLFNNFVGTSVVKIRGLKTENRFLNK